MNVNDQNIVTAPVSSDGTGDVGGGSCSPVPLDAAQGRCEVEAPQSTPSQGTKSPKLQAMLSSSARRGAEHSLETTLANLKSAIKHQYKALNAMMKNVDHLNVIKEKTRSTAITNAIDEVIHSSEALMSATTSVHGTYYEAEKAAFRTKDTHQHTTSPNIQEAILKVCEDLKDRLDKQQEDINELKTLQATSTPSYASRVGALNMPPPAVDDLLAGPSTAEQSSQAWTKVNRAKSKHNPRTSPNSEPATKGSDTEVRATVNKKKKTRKPSNASANDGKSPGLVSSKRPRRPPPDAIAIKPAKEQTFADILKAVREVDVDKTGAHITSIAESRGGEVLIKVARGESKRSDLEAVIRDTLGDRATVRGLVSYADLDIVGLDGVTTDTEIADALKKAAGLQINDSSVRVKSVRPAPNGTRRATASMKRVDAPEIIKAGKIRIGLVWAKVRLCEKIPRCFNCLGFGHIRSKCTGMDRRDACSLCTSTDHRAAECRNPPKCVSCEDQNSSTDHFPGSSKCTSYKKAQLHSGQAPISQATTTPHQ